MQWRTNDFILGYKFNSVNLSHSVSCPLSYNFGGINPFKSPLGTPLPEWHFFAEGGVQEQSFGGGANVLPSC